MEYRRIGYSDHRRVIRLEPMENGTTKVWYTELDEGTGNDPTQEYTNYLHDFIKVDQEFIMLKPGKIAYSVF